MAFFQPQQADAKIADAKEIKIASWNLLNFGGGTGKWKINNATALQAMSDVITNDYDIIFVQELQNKTNRGLNTTFDGFVNLCKDYLGPAGYKCADTPNIGTENGGNGEGYGVVYKDKLSLKVEDTKTSANPSISQGATSTADSMARPPMMVTVDFGGDTQILVFNNHDNPSYVKHELSVLENKISSSNLTKTQNIIVLGDLNADGKPSSTSGIAGTCKPSNSGDKKYDSGAPGNPHVEFAEDNGWFWVIPNDRTYKTNFGTSPSTGCVYDRIIISSNMNYSYYDHTSNFGVVGDIPPGNAHAGTEFGDKTGVWNYIKANNNTAIGQLSDHRLVWAKFNFGGIESTDSAGNTKTRFMNHDNEPVCNNPDTIYAKGEGFVPNDTADIYVTKYPDNQNIIAQPQQQNSTDLGNFKRTDQSYQLTDASGTYDTVTSDADGNIANTALWTLPDPLPGNPEFYNIIVDVNQDGNFTNSIDVIDVFNDSGLQVSKCNDKKRKLVFLLGALATRDGTSGTSLDIGGEDLPPENPLQTRQVHVINYDSTIDMQTDTISNLSQKSVFSSDVYITTEGVFGSTITWTNPTAGIYNIILDLDDDDTYNPGTDVVDHTNEIGLIIADDRSEHNDIVHMGDNGLEREVYNTGIVQNIYTLAKNLPVDDVVDIYTISERLLKINNPEWTTWENGNNVNLLESAAPVYEFGEKITTAHTSSDGTLFLSSWKEPSKIFDQPFINYYGKKYNIIIDVNQDGIFDVTADKVDTHDIGDMTNWFNTQGHVELSPAVGSGQTVAVSEYKEYLNDKLDLENQLDTTNDIYDPATENASFQYICLNKVTDKLFTVIQTESQVGIRVLDEDEYYEGRDQGTGRHVYDQAEFASFDVDDDSVSVVVGADGSTMEINDLSVGENSNLYLCQTDNVEINNITTSENSETIIQTNTVKIGGEINIEPSSTSCLVAAGVGSIAAGTTVVAAVDPEPLSKTILAILIGASALAEFVSGSFCTP